MLPDRADVLFQQSSNLAPDVLVSFGSTIGEEAKSSGSNNTLISDRVLIVAVKGSANTLSTGSQTCVLR
jgi:hypothetical protein